MKYLKIIFVLVFAFFLVCCKKGYNNYQSYGDYKPGLFKEKYTNVSLFIDDYHIANENYFQFLYKKNKKIIKKGFTEIISVDKYIIDKFVDIKKNKLSLIFIGHDSINNEVTIINKGEIVSVVKNISKVGDITLYGFLGYSNNNELMYYDFNGKLRGENYTSIDMSTYYMELYKLNDVNSTKQDCLGFLPFLKGNKYEVFIGNKKIDNVTNYFNNEINRTYVLQIDELFYVYDYSGNLLDDRGSTKNSGIDNVFLLYDKNLYKYYYLLNNQNKIYIDEYSSENDIILFNVTDEHVFYKEIKTGNIIYQTLKEKQVFDKNYEFENYYGLYILTNSTSQIFVNSKGKIIYEFSGLNRASLLKEYEYIYLDGNNLVRNLDCHIITFKDNLHNNYIYYFKDTTMVYNLQPDQENLEYVQYNILKYTKKDGKNYLTTYINPMEVNDLSKVQFYKDINVNKYGQIYVIEKNKVSIIDSTTTKPKFTIELPFSDNDSDLYSVEITQNYFYSYYYYAILDNNIETYLIQYSNTQSEYDKNIIFITFNSITKQIVSKINYNYRNNILNNANLFYEGSSNDGNVFKLESNGKLFNIFNCTEKKYIVDYLNLEKNTFLIAINNEKYQLLNIYGKVILSADSISIVNSNIIVSNKGVDKIYDIRNNKFISTPKDHFEQFKSYYYLYNDGTKQYLYNGNGKLVDKNKVVEYDNDTCKMVFYSETYKSYKTIRVDKFNLDNKYYYYGVR